MNHRQIDVATPGQTLWDDQIRGLHLRAFPTKKSFYLKYRTRSGQQRKPKLGDYGTVNLSQARELARDRMNIVLSGGDPDADRTQYTVDDLKKRFMDVHAIKRKVKTQEMYRIAWGHVLASLKASSVADVTRKDISDLHYRMRDRPVQANRTLAVLHKAFNLAELWGWRPPHSNPVRGIDKYKEHKRRRLPTPDEAVRLIRAMDECEKEQPFFVAFLWLLAWTGCRPSEIRTARWEWIEGASLHLPDSKGGQRVIALSSPAREVIAKIPKVKGNPYLIPGHKNESCLVGVKKLWKHVLDRAGITGLQMRDLRRFFASLGLSGGLTLEAVGQLLGHTQAQTTKVYAFLLTDAANRATEATAAELVKIRRAARKRH